MSNDSLSLVNSFMLSHKMRFPLIIDPTGNIYKFIKNLLNDQIKMRKLEVDKKNRNKMKRTEEKVDIQIIERKNHDNNFKSALKNSLEFGHKILVSSCENINMVLSALISTGIDTSFSRPIQMFKEKIYIDKNFDLYMFVSTEEIHLNPYIASKIMVVNFSINNS